ncbi:MAG: quinol:cytochrome C oxidoreductase [Candidatus Eisenbacteria bacterium]|uniref:Quinol:cytochrome C oxidoreductase n=1 Tax=Eiseniibacteriota bacterium TaxID=2212470 RepID=A0A956N984_UNCEI|nr:quinol:cytochrome C oxidoreductase [Candidatus Eisenbacteria bacterium]MCB9464923.1 quinol:cytochrome C oxidoreductase [Candidatus Eisenbacteria bacterium]
MHHHGAGEDNWVLGGAADGVFRIGLVIGILGLAASFFLGFGQGNVERFYSAWLVSFGFFLAMSLGALFFVLAQHLTGATWSVVVRRLAEAVSTNLGLMLIFFIPVALGLKTLYPWADPEVMAHDALLQSKQGFLNTNFFYIRTAIYFVVWIAASQYFFRRSVSQDETGSVGTTLGLEKTAAPVTLLFAVTTTFASFDYFMSLEPHWFSTMFGVYYFAGSLFSFFAFLPLMVIFAQSKGRAVHTITKEHFHDMGKWMFAFTVFWAYIGFSQYFLIWYANIPEETGWFYVRQNNGWATISWLMLIGHFIIPFFGLLPRWVKKTRMTLVVWAIWMLAMHWFDLFWLIVPNANPNGIPWHPLYLTCFLGIGGIYFATIALTLKNKSMIPAKDPRLPDSLAFENV